MRGGNGYKRKTNIKSQNNNIVNIVAQLVTLVEPDEFDALALTELNEFNTLALSWMSSMLWF